MIIGTAFLLALVGIALLVFGAASQAQPERPRRPAVPGRPVRFTQNGWQGATIGSEAYRRLDRAVRREAKRQRAAEGARAARAAARQVREF